MQRPQAGEAFAQNLNRHTRFQARLGHTGSQDHVADIFPALGTELALGFVVKGLREQVAQIEAIHPFHNHDANAVMRDEVVQVEKIVVLNQRHPRGDLGDALHVRLVTGGVTILLRRKYLERDRKAEKIASLTLTEINDPLASLAQQSQLAVMSCPQNLGVCAIA